MPNSTEHRAKYDLNRTFLNTGLATANPPWAAVVAFYAFEVLANSVRLGSRANTPLQTPLWIPQGIWLAGLVFFLLTIFLVTLKALVLFLRGNLPAIDRLAGLPSASEEVEQELASVKARKAK